MSALQSGATGLDRLLSDDAQLAKLKGKRVGVLAHAASVTTGFVHIVDALLEAGVTIVRLFGPEHGLRGAAQDMIGVDSGVDPLTGLPTISLYGHSFDTLTPEDSALQGLDLLVVDLQDVGARYYTYVYTAWLAAKVALDQGVEVLLLDRANPIGRAVEGPPLPPDYTSFVGMLPGLPSRHGFTLAEVVTWGLGDVAPAGLTVIRERPGATPWVMPSPNMPTIDTALVYPGQCLLEGTTMSEGRGTTRPFELFGAPWLDADRIAASLNSLELDGVTFRPTMIEPTFQKHAGEACGALQMHVTSAETFHPVLTSAVLLAAIATQHPQDFGWRQEPYEFVSDRLAIDLLAGGPSLRLGVESDSAMDAARDWAQTPPETLARVDDWRRRFDDRHER